MATIRRSKMRALMVGSSLLAVAACSTGFDMDFRDLGNGFDTTEAVRGQAAPRPNPDDRGIISYPSFQVAVAEPGDTIADVAGRVGMDADELARYNGIGQGVRLRRGEVIALPRRVAEPSPATGADRIDITTLAGDALDRADSQPKPAPFQTKPEPAQTGAEPVRHKVERGETAYSISRLYKVSVRSLADWNGLGPELTVREGQYLLIPVAAAAPERRAAVDPDTTTAPGVGSPTPTPPSASKPLPEDDTTPATATPAPPSPNLAEERTTASADARLLLPVSGKIIRAYEKRKNDGIGIAAPAGTPVKAAADGIVAAITRDTDQVPILVLRHPGNLLTVYANISDVTFEKGAKVSRGQTIAKVREGDPSFLHFEVREGFDSVDPLPYVN